MELAAPAASWNGVADVLAATADLAWPLIVAFVALRIAPTLRDVLASRPWRAEGPAGLAIEVGEQELPAQEALESQRREIEALRAQLSLVTTIVSNASAQLARSDQDTQRPIGLLESTLAVHDAESDRDEPPTGATGARENPSSPARVLWVDDRPASNAYEIAAMLDRGITVVQAESTAAALRLLATSADFDAVITDLHREEAGTAKPRAGLTLIERAREMGLRIPMFVYSSAEEVERYRSELYEAGALGATSEATELLELLGVNFGPGYGLRLQREVKLLLRDSGLEPVESGGRGVDFVLERGDYRIGVEVKAWLGAPDERALNDLIIRLDASAGQYGMDEIWLVTPAPLEDIPEDVNRDWAVRLLTFEGLREELRKEVPDSPNKAP